MTEARHCALVVANDVYQDPKLRRLRAPAADAQELARVLSDPAIGGFEVELSLNEPEHVVRRRLAAFFHDRGLDDLLLLHLSCHGLKDDDGRLYFATADTDIAHLDATSIPSDFVNRQMSRSRSRRIVLLLDCCYSGAFATGLLSRAGDRVDIMERFDGRGRAVLTASSAMEYSFEGDVLSGEGHPSVFTSALVRGLETGAADRNRDGWITVDELYDYAYDEVRAVTPSQTPGKWTFDVQGEVYLARSLLEPPAVELPDELVNATKSHFAHIRSGAVDELAGLLRGPDAGLAGAARTMLEELRDDDSRRVSDAAALALAETAASEGVMGREPPARVERPEVETVQPLAYEAAEVASEPPEPLEIREPVEVREPVAARQPVLPVARAAWLARLGAFALLAALPVPLSADYVNLEWNVFAVLSPVEAVGVAVIVASIAATLRKSGASALAAGMLVGFGVLTAVAALSLIIFSTSWLNAIALLLSIVVGLGALAIVAAGGATTRPEPDAGRTTLVPIALGVAGTVVCFMSLSVAYDGSSALSAELQDADARAYFLVPGAAIALAVIALILLTRRTWTQFAAGLLLAIGAQGSLHFVGLIVAAWRAIGEVGEVRAGGFIALLGTVLIGAAGFYARFPTAGLMTQRSKA